MKYLVFNITVFLALAYLIVNGKAPDMSATVQKVRAEIQQVRESEVKPEPVEVPVQKVVQEIVPVKTPEPQPKKIVEREVAVQPQPPAAPPPMPEPVEVVKQETKTVPSRRQEAAREVAQVAPQVIDENVAETKDIGNPLEDAKARSMELRQMVADMERMFAEKMTQ